MNAWGIFKEGAGFMLVAVFGTMAVMYLGAFALAGAFALMDPMYAEIIFNWMKTPEFALRLLPMAGFLSIVFYVIELFFVSRESNTKGA